MTTTLARQRTLAPQEDPAFIAFAAALRQWEATGERIAEGCAKHPNDPRAAFDTGEWDRRYYRQRDDLVRQAAAVEERLGLASGSVWGMVGE
jgi:hypothetical protein